MRTVYRTRTLVAFGVVLVLGPGAAKAGADAIFDVFATTSLTLQGFRDIFGNPISDPAGLFISANPRPPITTLEAGGDGSGSVAGRAYAAAAEPSDLRVGEGIVQEAGGRGVATGPGSFITVTGLTDSVVSLNNGGGDSFFVDFFLDYRFRVESHAGDPVEELAVADVQLLVGTLNEDVLDLAAFSDTGLGGGLFTGADSFGFGVFLQGFGEDEIFVLNDVSGEAASFASAPEPGTLTLFVMGLVLVAGVSRSRTRPCS